MWTRFMDMCSGGSCKVDIDGVDKEYIYIELPSDEAISLFESRFSRDPFNVSCECCGEDYSISEHDTLEKATAYDRKHWHNREGISVEEYVKRPDVLIIRQVDM